MNHTLTFYEDLLADFCRSAGIPHVTDVVTSHHFEIDGCVIGLIPELEADEPTISLYVQICSEAVSHDSSLCARMLAWNMSPPLQTAGCLAIHPETGAPVYCLRVNASELDGKVLAILVQTHIDAASSAMEQISHP